MGQWNSHSELQVEVVFPELFQDLRDVVAMFGQVPGVNQDVIDVHYYKLVEKLPENLVRKAIRHYMIFVVRL